MFKMNKLAWTFLIVGLVIMISSIWNDSWWISFTVGAGFIIVGIILYKDETFKEENNDTRPDGLTDSQSVFNTKS